MSFSVPLMSEPPKEEEEDAPIFSAPQAHLGAHPQSAMVVGVVLKLVGREEAFFFFFFLNGRWRSKKKEAVQ